MVRTFSRTKDGVLDYCETRKLSYTVIKSGSATVTVGIAALQSRDYQVQIAKFEYQSCNGGAGLKLPWSLISRWSNQLELDFSSLLSPSPDWLQRVPHSSQASCHEAAAYSVAVGDAFSGVA